jgi:hypothetical protein
MLGLKYPLVEIESGSQGRELGYKFRIHRLWMVVQAKGIDKISQGENVK